MGFPGWGAEDKTDTRYYQTIMILNMIYPLYQHGMADREYKQVPSINVSREQQSSQKVTSSLKDHIFDPNREYGHDIIKDSKKRDQEEADKI